MYEVEILCAWGKKQCRVWTWLSLWSFSHLLYCELPEWWSLVVCVWLDWYGGSCPELRLLGVVHCFCFKTPVHSHSLSLSLLTSYRSQRTGVLSSLEPEVQYHPSPWQHPQCDHGIWQWIGALLLPLLTSDDSQGELVAVQHTSGEGTAHYSLPNRTRFLEEFPIPAVCILLLLSLNTVAVARCMVVVKMI